MLVWCLGLVFGLYRKHKPCTELKACCVGIYDVEAVKAESFALVQQRSYNIGDSFRQVTNSVKALCTLWERPQAHGVAVCGVGAFVLEFQHSRLALHSLENALTAVE